MNKSASLATIYINGSIVNNYDRTYVNNTITNLRIGAGTNESVATNFLSNGSKLDDFRMYNKVLSLTEIQGIITNTFNYYNGGGPVLPGSSANIKTIVGASGMYKSLPAPNTGSGGGGFDDYIYVTQTSGQTSNIYTDASNNTYKVHSFVHSGGSETQTSFTVDFPTGTVCDILIIGGGGAGATDRAGGGGAGACIVYKDYVMNGTYKIKVGNKGLKVSSGNGNNGYDSEISNLTESTIYFRAKGGGGGGVHIANGVTGGCGGGGGSQGNFLGGSASSLNIVNSVANISPSSTSSYVVYGNIGGRTTFPYTGNNLPELNGAGGGGIGQGGTLSGALNPVDAPQYDGGKGGDGLYQATINGTNYNFKNYFGVNGKLESEGYYYIGGGGGGGDHSTGVGGVGGKGGGGTGGDDTVGIDALSYGSGGGGGGGTNKQGGDGFAGIVILRYKINPTTYTYTDASNNTYKVHSFTYNPTVVEQKTDVGGWRLVRFLPPTSTAWHPTNDNLVGTETYGTAYNNTNAWSIPFGTFDEFCFGTLNLQKWLYCKKTSVYGNYSNTARDIIKSSYSSTPYQANWYS